MKKESPIRTAFTTSRVENANKYRTLIRPYIDKLVKHPDYHIRTTGVALSMCMEVLQAELTALHDMVEKSDYAIQELSRQADEVTAPQGRPAVARRGLPYCAT